MALLQLTAKATTFHTGLTPFTGLRLAAPTTASPTSFGFKIYRFHNVLVRAATTVAPKFTTLKPLGDRVLVKIQSSEEKTQGGILLPTTAQTKPQGGEVVAVGEGKTISGKKVELTVQTGSKIVYSKYAGTEIEFNGINHLLLKEDDILGLLETDDIKDLKPLNDRVLIKVAEAEEKTAGGVLLTESAKEKPVVGTVAGVGAGAFDDSGSRKPLEVAAGNSVLYSKYAGSDFKSKDGSQYVVLKGADVLAVLS
eukprot:c20152_g2_i2 orf=181-939(+)